MVDVSAGDGWCEWPSKLGAQDDVKTDEPSKGILGHALVELVCLPLAERFPALPRGKAAERTVALPAGNAHLLPAD